MASKVDTDPFGAFIAVYEEARFGVTMVDGTPSQNPLQPIYNPTDPAVISYEEVPFEGVIVTGLIAGQAYLNILDPQGCPAGELNIIVEASGPWDINVDGRSADNCHFEESPDFVPIPDILKPDLVYLTIDPYVVTGSTSGIPELTRYFTLDWRDNVSGLNMSGDSQNTFGDRFIRIGGTLLDPSGTIGYQHGCDIEFDFTSLKGTCDFRKYEVTFPSSDVCQGEYVISGRKL
jgi:hypothetical protein